jgi:phosphoenolpyruvate carboxylase
MTVFDDVLFRVVPQVYRRAESALVGDQSGTAPAAMPAFVRLGSWIGGDRDGNAHVTSAVVTQAMAVCWKRCSRPVTVSPPA